MSLGGCLSGFGGVSPYQEIGLCLGGARRAGDTNRIPRALFSNLMHHSGSTTTLPGGWLLLSKLRFETARNFISRSRYTSGSGTSSPGVSEPERAPWGVRDQEE